MSIFKKTILFSILLVFVIHCGNYKKESSISSDDNNNTQTVSSNVNKSNTKNRQPSRSNVNKSNTYNRRPPKTNFNKSNRDNIQHPSIDKISHDLSRYDSNFAASSFRCGSVGERSCHKKEIRFIQRIKSIIKELETPLAEDRNFFNIFNPKTGREKNFSQEKFVFIGENHSDYISILDNYRFLNSIVDSDNLLLLEGDGEQQNNLELSDYFGIILTKIYTVWENERDGKEYDPDLRHNQRVEYYKLWSETRLNFLEYKNLDLYKHKVQVNFWDNEEFLNSKVTSNSLTVRNNTMVEVLQRRQFDHKRIFVVAGKSHLPSAEFDLTKNKAKLIKQGLLLVSDDIISNSLLLFNENNPSYRDYFSYGHLYHDSLVTTKSIYDFMQDKIGVFVLHKRIFA